MKNRSLDLGQRAVVGPFRTEAAELVHERSERFVDVMQIEICRPKRNRTVGQAGRFSSARTARETGDVHWRWVRHEGSGPMQL